ncbi:MAG: hypothetical protein AABX99_01580 [Nanoarchaeota archaeon]
MKIKKGIVNEIKLKLSQIPEVVSLTLVGSHSELDKPIEKITDLDFIIIVNKLDISVYEKINQSLKSVAKKFNSKDMNTYVEERIGPVKLEKRKKFNLIIHQIIFDIGGYVDYCKKSPLSAYDWQNFKPVFGKDLKKINHIKKITYEDLIDKRLGINYYLRVIRENTIFCLKYKIIKKNLILTKFPVKISEGEKLQLIYSALFFVMSNILKISTQKNFRYNEKKLTHAFFDKFSETHYKLFFVMVLDIKNKIRNKEKIAFDAEKIENEAVKFLNELKRTISNFPK